MANNSTITRDMNILEQNCRDGWPIWTCIFGNVCGLCSTTLWFLVLLPQVWRNFRRKSVKGLSVLWATANFTASLINLFFVFMYASIPLYGQISSVYCPILELMLLGQFWAYGRKARKMKLLYGGGCIILWSVLLSMEVVFSLEDYVEYVAILLWCVETFPQVILNMRLQSTAGQATGSVAIAMVGKTTDFFSNNILVLPLQYVIMTYFSSSVAYVNGFQVAWYYGQSIDEKSPEQQETSTYGTGQSQSSINNDVIGIGQSTASILPSMPPSRTSLSCYCVRLFCMVLTTALLLLCVVGFVLNVHSWFGLFAPVCIALVMVVSYAYIVKHMRSEFVLPVR